MELREKTFDEIESIVSSAIEDAVDFVETEISEIRIKNAEYMDGKTSLGHEEGRSRVVSSKVRDTIQSVKPSILRVFMSTDKPVEFVPKGPDDVAIAEQATDFIHHEFQRLNGYKILNDLIHDALVKKQGIAKAYYKTYPKAKIHMFTDLTADELTLLVNEPGVEVLEQSSEMNEEDDAPYFSVKIQRTETKGELCLESVPSEEFFISREAKDIDSAYVVAHRTEMRAGDVVEMGFDPEIVYDLDSFDSDTGVLQEEKTQRRGYNNNNDDDENALDPAMKNVLITEAYMRLDVDGTGVPVLHKFVMGGTSYKLMDYEPCERVPLVKIEVDPEPHSFYGHSLAEKLCDDQDAATSVLRGILDNVALTNSPRIGFVNGQVAVEDLLNNEIGGLIRMNAPGQVQDMSVPFVAGQTLSALTYLDKMVEAKSGVSQNIALNPDALQSTTKSAVTAAVEAAAGQVEVMCRNIAEGFKDLFKLLLELTHKNFDEEKIMKLNGVFVPVDPTTFDLTYDVSINVGLGTGREDERVAALQQALQLQMQVYAQYGAQNGLVSLTNIRNSLADILAVNGVRNSDRYFAPINQEIEQQMLAQQQQQQQAMSQQQQDPNAAYLQAEQLKAQTKAGTDMAKLQLEAAKATAQDDRERDKMAQDLMVNAAKIAGQYGATVDVAAIKAEQDKMRTVAGIAQQGMNNGQQ